MSCLLPERELMNSLKGPSSWSGRYSLPSKPAGSGILIKLKIEIFYPGTGHVSFVCVLSCVVSGGGHVIVLTTHSGRPALVYLSSVLVHSLLLPLQASDPQAFGF